MATLLLQKHYNHKSKWFDAVNNIKILEVIKMAFVYDDRGVQYNNEADMCLDYGIPVWAFKIRMAMQYPVGIALTAPKYEYRNLTCCDFRGVQFPTLYDMCDYYGVTIENFEARAEAEWDLRRILTMR